MSDPSMAIPNDFDDFLNSLEFEALQNDLPNWLSAPNTGLPGDNSFEQNPTQGTTGSELPAINQQIAGTTPPASGSKRKLVDNAYDIDEQDHPRNKRPRDSNEASNVGSSSNSSAQASTS